ncbi:GAF domain-containing protein [Microbacterium sp.]|uniref:GAF domain-containing protein n=1 Tax=Microbacterium sp. TaxID=51671 RepID=UPI0028122A56|nr:GAF domain-containing protein [Microbacterium sp.]
MSGTRTAHAISVFRAPMRSRRDDVPDGPAVERALTLGVCGMGGRLMPPPPSLEDALAAAHAQLGDRVARRIERFAAAADGAFVWTRDIDDQVWLGRLAGPWRYDPAPDALDVDLVHVRSCDWLEAPVSPAALPPAVRVAFARGGRNWQRIRADDVSTLTAALWERGERAQRQR